MSRIRVDINGVIGEDFWNPEASNTVKTVIQQIGEAKAGDTLEVHVNSGGGSFFEGLAIYNTLRQYEARGVIVETWVDGLAASAASIIMLAGDRRVVSKSAMVMIHNVWSWAVGDANDMEKAAKELRQFNAVAATTYAERTKENKTTALALMDEETWMEGEECLTRGFATEVGHGATNDNDEQAVAAARAQAGSCAIMGNLKKTPAWLKAAASTERVITPTMVAGLRPVAPVATVTNTNTQIEANPQTPQAAAPVIQEKPMSKENEGGAATTEPDVQAAVAEAIANESARAKAVREKITNQLTAGTITQAQADALIKAHVDTVSPVAVANEAILTAIEATASADPDQQMHRQASRVTEDASNKFAAGVAQAVMASVGLENRDPSNEFNTLISPTMIARECLHRSNVSGVQRMSNAQVGKAILAMHTTGDFPLIMENLIDKLVLKGFEEVIEVYDQLTRRITVGDYKTVKMVGTDMFPSLALVEEGANYEYGTFGEHGAEIKVAKYGKLISFTEEVFINDDRNFLNDVPRKMGQAAKRTIGNLFWGNFLSNPTFNGASVFASQFKNYRTGAGSALNDAGLKGADTLFSTRTEADIKATGQADATIAMEAKFLIAGRAQKHDVTRLLEAEYVAAASGVPSNVKNTFRGMYTPVFEPRIDRTVGGGTRWWLQADPNMYDVTGLAFLDGQDTPLTSREEEWRNDSLTFKVKLPGVGARFIGRAGVQQNEGV
jgi:ATP-dependent protease ClpP protease subunit